MIKSALELTKPDRKEYINIGVKRKAVMKWNLYPNTDHGI